MEERKKRGRPVRDADAQANKGRPARIPMSAGNKLSAPKREGYQRYWAITGPDHPGKLDQMVAAYWDFVLVDGERVEQPAGKGNTHVLMEIEEHYYQEDMAAQQKRNMDATQHKVQALGESEYIPKGHDKVVTRELI